MIVDNKVIAGKKEAIETIVNVMKVHMDNEDVCDNGCGALTNITSICKIIIQHDYKCMF